MNEQEPAPATGRACHHCGGPIPPDQHGLQRYCNAACRNRAYRKRNPEVLEGYMERHRENLKELHEGLDDRAPLSIARYKRQMVSAAKARAKKQGIPFNLTAEDIHIPDFCPVLGIELEFNRGGRGASRDTSPSLDKVVPALGYVRGNVLVISNRANRIKSDASVTELEQVAAFFKKHLSKNWMVPNG